MKLKMIVMLLFIMVYGFSLQDLTQVLKLSPGETINYPLDSNPTTGFNWYPNISDCVKEKFLQLYSKEKPINYTYVQDDHPKGWVGVGGKMIFHIQSSLLPKDQNSSLYMAQKKKGCKIKFSYVRPWEKNV